MQRRHMSLHCILHPHNADLGDIIVNTIKAIPRPENPTIYDASIPTYDKDNPLSFWNPATIEVNALNGLYNNRI